MPRKKLRMNSSARNSERGGDRSGARAGQAHAEPERHREREDAAGAGDEQPQQRRAVVAREENGVVKMTGSGFQLGPVVVTRSPLATSRPQMIHAHGS